MDSQPGKYSQGKNSGLKEVSGTRDWQNETAEIHIHM